MTDIQLSTDSVEDRLLDSILAADRVVVGLRCDDVDALVDSLRALARRTGSAIYFWRARSGLCRLPGPDQPIPGVVQLADVLRFVERSPHFGVYFVADLPSDWGAYMPGLLRRIARIDASRPWRLVLVGAPADLPRDLPMRELVWAGPAGGRLRLRHGAWVH